MLTAPSAAAYCIKVQADNDNSSIVGFLLTQINNDVSADNILSYKKTVCNSMIYIKLNSKISWNSHIRFFRAVN